MKLKWLGHACFELTLDNGKVLVTDPYDDSVEIVNTPGVHEICGATVTGVPSFHDDAGGSKRGQNLIFVIEADGLRIAHLGDLGHLPDTEEQQAALTGLDVMLIPIGGFFTIDTQAAVQIIETFKPRCAVAMHFANDYCHFPVSDESEFVQLTGAARLPKEIEITKEQPSGCCVMAY